MWRFAAARVTGKSHLKAALPCQDQLACAVLPSGTFVAAVSDGAGSAIMAERGARLTVGIEMEHVTHAVEGGRSDFGVVLREGGGKAREAVLTEEIEHGSEPPDFACTAVVA